MTASVRVSLAATVLMASAILLQGCAGSWSWVTWRGKSIYVSGASTSINAGKETAEIEVGGHRIVVNDSAVSLDGITRSVPRFRQLTVQTTPGAVQVSVDAKQVFP